MSLRHLLRLLLGQKLKVASHINTITILLILVSLVGLLHHRLVMLLLLLVTWLEDGELFTRLMSIWTGSKACLSREHVLRGC